MGTEWSVWAERKCKCCGKIFIVEDTSKWAYKDHDGSVLRWFCTWKCLCSWRDCKARRTAVRNRAAKRFAPALTDIRMHFGLSIHDTAVWLGISPNTYKSYDAADGVLPEKHAVRLAEGFGCTVDDIYSDKFNTAAADGWKCIIPHTTQRGKRRKRE